MVVSVVFLRAFLTIKTVRIVFHQKVEHDVIFFGTDIAICCKTRHVK